MLKITKNKYELTPDPGLFIFFERSARGQSSSYFFNRYRKINNKYLKSYNSKQELKHIIYLNTNHLYGYVISKFLSNKWIQMDRS